MKEQQNRPTREVPPKMFEILDRQIQFAGEFLAILEEEKAALVAMDMQVLISITKKKMSQLKRIHLLDRALKETLEHFAPTPASSNVKVVKLSSLIPLFSRDDAKKIKGRRDELMKMQEEIQARNRLNKRFTDDVLGYLGDAISLITGTVADKAVYGARGMARSVGNSPSLISTEV